MNTHCAKLAVPAALLLANVAARAQALPTAEARITLSAFGMASANFTGLELAKNLAITAGGDLGFRSYRGFFPAIEVRGSYPIASGQLVSERNILAGVRIGRRKDRFAPYGDALFGRGQINYLNGGYPNTDYTLLYAQNTSNVYSLGGGLDYTLTDHFAAKADFQFQRYRTPVTIDGNLYSKLFSLGVVYRFGSRTVR